MKKCTKIGGNKINTNEMNDTESIQKKKKIEFKRFYLFKTRINI